MSKADNLKDFLIDVADAIRAKKGSTELINPQDFSSEIASLSGGLEIVDMTETTATIEPNKVYVWGMVESLDITLGASTGEDDFFAFRFRCSKPTMTVVTVNGATWAADTELNESGKPILDLGSYYQCEIKGGTSALYARPAHYIPFEDSNVEAVLMSKGIGDGIGITYADAAKVTTFGSIFKGNTDITAFDELESFTSFTYIDNDSAFYGCTSLKSINIENIVDLLSNRSETTYGIFNGCINLENIGNTAKLETIGNNMFYKCEKLRGCFSFPSLKSIKPGAFNSSAIYIIESLGDVSELPGSESAWGSSGIFQNCASLLKINIPERLKKIGNSTFNGCSSLTEIAFPASLTSIGSSAFNGCSKLAIASGLGNTQLTSIWDYAFKGCSALTEIAFPASLTSIGNNAFQGCSALTEIAFPASLTSIGGSAFNGCSKLAIASDLGNTQVTSIKSSAFNGCSSLTEIAFPASLTSIGNGAFNGCTLLKEIAFPHTLTTIGQYAFINCKALTKASGLGDTQVTVFQSELFNGCSSLTEIAFPASLTSIGSYAFYGCSALTYIKILATTPPALSSSAIPSTIGAIYVPDESIGAYQAATNWSSFASKIKGISEMPTE